MLAFAEDVEEKQELRIKQTPLFLRIPGFAFFGIFCKTKLRKIFFIRHEE